MMNEPFGITAISGQVSHSLKLSFGLRNCSISGVSGCTPLAAKNCCGGAAGGFWLDSAGGAGFGCGRFDFADASPATQIASVAANAASSFSLTVMGDPLQEQL
jgi:hypothetical protein